MHILLFDIDGTLIRSGGAGKAAMERGLEDAFGIRFQHDTIPYGGRTDVAIGRDLLNVHGLEPTDDNLAKLQAAYQHHLDDTLNKFDGAVLPGIQDALRVLHGQPTVALGLLTGNVQSGARKKLLHFGLWDFFAFGGFADGTPDRNVVAQRAYAEATRHVQQDVPGDRVWVIGDTRHDVTCARSINARAIAVETGGISRAELATAEPDYLFKDFREAESLFAVWGVSR
jgi:phosphoglycolate phosphatase